MLLMFRRWWWRVALFGMVACRAQCPACRGELSCDELPATCAELEDALAWDEDACDCSRCLCANEEEEEEEEVNECLGEREVSTTDGLASAIEARACSVRIVVDTALSVSAELVVVASSGVAGPGVISALRRSRIFRIAADARVNLTNLEVRDGVGLGLGGGCVFVERRGTLVATNVTFTNCTTPYAGGAILGWTTSRVILAGFSAIRGSTADYGGGVFAFEGSTLALADRTRIEGSHAANKGGGVYVGENVSLTLEGDASVIGCTASIFGGGLAAWSRKSVSSVLLRDASRIADCSTGFYGGSIFAWTADVTLEGRATISGGSALFGGCVFVHMDSTFWVGGTVTRCTATGGAAALMTWTGARILVSGNISRGVASYGSGGGVFAYDGVDVVLTGLLSDCAAFQGGGLMTSSGATLFVDGGTIARCDGTHGGGAYATAGARVVVDGGGVIEKCVSDIDGGGLYFTGSSSLEMRNAATIRSCAAITGNGGGVSLPQSSTAHLSSGATIENNLAAEAKGGGISSAGLVALAGAVRFVANVARDGAGIFSRGEDSIVVASPSSCGFVRVTIDYSDSGASEAGAFVYHAVEKEPFDAWGAYTEVAAAIEGGISSSVVCVPPGPTTILAYSTSSVGWGSGTLEYALLSQAGSPTRTGLTVPRGSHATTETFSLDPPPGSGTTPGAVLFEGNVARRDGGAVAVSDRATLRLAGVELRLNVAQDSGGAVYVDALSELRAVGCTFRNNSAIDGVGGGIHATTLSSTVVDDAHAVGNTASAGGGFASLYAVADATFGGLVARRNAATDEEAAGGGIFVRATDSETASVRVASSILEANRVDGAEAVGGAIAVREASLRIDNARVASNVAVAGNGGALAAVDDARVTFGAATTTRVDVVTDMTATTFACEPVSLDGIDDTTCDSYDWQGCASISSMAENGTSCRGCACVGDRYFAVSSSSASSFYYEGSVRAASLKVDTLELEPGDYSLRAYDAFSESWWGGTVAVYVHRAPGVTTGPEIATKFGPALIAGDESEPLVFKIGSPKTNVARENAAPLGGGAAVYWDTYEPVGLSTIVDENNTGKYGDFVATPAVEFRGGGSSDDDDDDDVVVVVDNNNNNNNTSSNIVRGASGMVLPTLSFNLFDNYDQLVTSSRRATIFVRVTSEGATSINDIAEFVDGRAIFDNLVVTLTPSSTVDAVVVSDIPSLLAGSVPFSFELRSCASNEFEMNGRCWECDAGTYLCTPLTCCACDKGMDCGEPGNSLHDLKLKKGWYRARKSSDKVYECEAKAACPASADVATCAEGHKAVLCSACKAGYFKNFHKKCQRCTDRERRFGYAAYGVLGFVVLVIVAWIVFCSDAVVQLWSSFGRAYSTGLGGAIEKIDSRIVDDDQDDDDDDDQDANKHRERPSLVAKGKLILTFLQILSSFPSVLAVPFPNPFSTFVLFAGFTNLDVIDLFATRCLFLESSSKNYFARTLVAVTMAPIFVGLFLFATYRAKKATASPQIAAKLRRSYAEGFLLLLHVVLPITSVMAFFALVCDDYDFGNGGTRSFLRKSPTINCARNYWHRFLRPYAVVVIAIYPIGCPLMYFAILFNHRHFLNPTTSLPPIERAGNFKAFRSSSFQRLFRRSHVNQRELHALRTSFSTSVNDKNDLILACKFLWGDYLPKNWYWEVVEAIRRILLTAVLAVVESGHSVQIAVGFITSSAFALAVVRTRPFFYKIDDDLAITTQACTSLTLFVTLLLKESIVNTLFGNISYFVLAFFPLIVAFSALFSIMTPWCCAKRRTAPQPDDDHPNKTILENTDKPPSLLSKEEDDDEEEEESHHCTSRQEDIIPDDDDDDDDDDKFTKDTKPDVDTQPSDVDKVQVTTADDDGPDY
ncbi:hypothetical protein CTAYLR_003116 [Chrysophaeum taylorii]|uniref:DUF7630 domain-containing protein n=1 Tax=Chrysophaeum taylorii TaxID=2483200 RepID=A0AAD7XNA7_9STRA|nr:hypothetical protein CTAYLR_003116 [Chrysophaeum taylorii]